MKGFPTRSDLRKPFRAPDSNELLLARRRDFLVGLLGSLLGIDEDLSWVAAYAPHISTFWTEHSIGILLAGALDLGGERAREIDDVLRQSAAGTHEVGTMGRHVTTAFLCSERRDGWEFIEKMLLAAQRQEGLRQSILEFVDFAHPDAFRHMLKVILDHNLVRYSATVRAVDVWLSLQLDAQSVGYVTTVLETIVRFLDDDSARESALEGERAESTYLALWCMAFANGPATVERAARLLGHPKPEMRLVAMHLLALLELSTTSAPAVNAVDDTDLRVATYAMNVASSALELHVEMIALDPKLAQAEPELANLSGGAIVTDRDCRSPAESGDLFEHLERLHARAPEKATASKPLVWPWMTWKMEQRLVADALVPAIGNRSPGVLLPYLESMSPDARAQTASLLGTQRTLDPASRQALLALAGDAAGNVRETAVKAMKKVTISPADLPALEPLLTRKASDLRRGVLDLILSLEDPEVLASAQRLIGSKNSLERLAGLELLNRMRAGKRSVESVTTIAHGYRAARPALDRDDALYLEKLLGTDAKELSLKDALGLLDPSARTRPTAPSDRKTKLGTPAAIKLIEMLDELVHTHRDQPVVVKQFGNDREAQPLGSVTQIFVDALEHDHRTGTCTERPLEELPLRDLWFEAYANRGNNARDADGLEAARAFVVSSLANEHMAPRLADSRGSIIERVAGKLPKIRYGLVVRDVLKWIVLHHAHEAVADFVVDGFETVLAAIPIDKLTDKSFPLRMFIGDLGALRSALKAIAEARGYWTTEHTRRMFGLLRWLDEPVFAPRESAESLAKQAQGFAAQAVSQLTDGKPAPAAKPLARARVDWKLLVEAFAAGWANEHDLFDALLGERPLPPMFSCVPRNEFPELTQATASLRQHELPEPVATIVQRAVARVLEIELARGEGETLATPAAMILHYAGGADALLQVVEAIGRDPKLQRTYAWGAASQGKLPVFSHLIRVTFPSKDDSPEQFAKAASAAQISEDSLLAVAFYAPQWARHVEAALAWPLFEEGVWWFHAHTKDSKWNVDCQIRESWNAEIRKLTPLTLEDLLEGAVDVAWFVRTYEALGRKRWERLGEFAKYASGGAGHKRALLFAEAMLGKLKKPALVRDIEVQRKQDAVRALGLLPLEKKAPKKDVLTRYQVLQDFVRTSRQFGSLRQAAEKLAARIGQENLARTAGFPDPIRLQWAMEGLASSDLARGPVAVTEKDVVVELSIDPDGLPELSARRGERTLKDIPADVKKTEAVAELVERKTELKRSASRMRFSLELAMCRGDAFSAGELVDLMGNVILRPMLERLVFVGDGIAGYPIESGKALRDHSGHVEPVKKDERLHLAHPIDLLASKKWTNWQRECFVAERVQPFKQVFRELYVPTAQERSDATFSGRYAGHQVNPRQALALLGSRGWVAAPEAGAFRTFHDEKLVAWLEFMETFYTPADIEGLTLEKVRFATRGSQEYANLADVPARVFSEVMRDVDLAVSVAHRGAVDPEASASTVELRASLLKETISLLGLKNVKIREPHVSIKGSLAEYSVHLGSATTHMLPGGTLVIVPVHSQHRGRIFLPFADDDPKTAEIMSKVLLLSRDSEIKDPNVLAQIRSAALG